MFSLNTTNHSCVLNSFRSVEINNTDAEGRLVLGDGVSTSKVQYSSNDNNNNNNNNNK